MASVDYVNSDSSNITHFKTNAIDHGTKKGVYQNAISHDHSNIKGKQCTQKQGSEYVTHEDIYFSQYGTESVVKENKVSLENQTDRSNVNAHIRAKSPPQKFEKSNKCQGDMATKTIPKASTMVQRSVDSLYEHETTGMSQRSCTSLKESGSVKTKALKNGVIILCGLSCIVILFICLYVFLENQKPTQQIPNGKLSICHVSLCQYKFQNHMNLMKL